MTKSLSMSKSATTAKTTAFGSVIDPVRKLLALPGMVYVELDVPEYTRNGLGRMIAKVLPYNFSDTEQQLSEAVSVGADASRSHVIYEDMHPTVFGTLSEVLSKNPVIARELYARHYGPEMVAVGIIISARMGLNFNEPESLARLLSFLETYSCRASWMESNILEVRLANAQALVGEGASFDWAQIFPAVDTGEA